MAPDQLHGFKTIAAFCLGFLLAGSSYGQVSLLEFHREKPIVTLEARFGYAINTATIDPTLITVVQDHQKALARGWRYDFAALYNVRNNFEIGLNAGFLRITDETVPVILIYIRAPGDTIKRQGPLYDRVNQRFYALRLDKNYEASSSLSIKPGVCIGLVDYEDYSDYAGITSRVFGQTFGAEFHIALEYFFDSNFSLSLNAAYRFSNLRDPHYSGYFGDYVLKGQTVDLDQFYISCGLRYSFTKKGGGMDDQKKPGRSDDKRNRFN